MSAPARTSAQLAWLTSLSLLAACFGGPTSDFPRGSKGDEDPTQGGVDDNDNNGGNNNGGDSEGASAGGASSGSNGAPGLDAGTASPPDSGDAAAPGTDGGMPCAWSTLPIDAASCGGSHCSLTRAELTATPSAVCEPSGSLDAVCTGDAQRVVHACWRNNMATVDRAAQVKQCAVADPLLVSVAATCIDCYVALHECISASCEAACATEASAACEQCTSAMCTPAFATCSGLTTP